jgi:hypothetical protein
MVILALSFFCHMRNTASKSVNVVQQKQEHSVHELFASFMLDYANKVHRKIFLPV